MRIVLFERKKYTRGSFLDKISNGCLKNGNSLASAWHNPTVSRCRVMETPGDTGRGDYVTIRCKPTDFYAMWLKIDVLNFFFLPFFLFPECVILEIGISSDIIRWWADCVGVYFLLIFFFPIISCGPIYGLRKKKKHSLNVLFVHELLKCQIWKI